MRLLSANWRIVRIVLLRQLADTNDNILFWGKASRYFPWRFLISPPAGGFIRNDTLHFLGGSEARAAPAPHSPNQQCSVIPIRQLAERNLPFNIMYSIFIRSLFYQRFIVIITLCAPLRVSTIGMTACW